MRLPSFFALMTLFCLLFWQSCSTPTTPQPDTKKVEEHKSADAGGADTVASKDTSRTDTALPDPMKKADEQPIEQPPEKLTVSYHGTIRALLEQNCNHCHVKGGIAPFPFTEYKWAHQYRESIKTEVVARRMPPWLADKTCKTYKHDSSLTDAQIKLFQEWVEQGAPEGTPGEYKAPTPKEHPRLERIDVTVKMNAPYKPVKSPDEYRCFVLDWPDTKTKFITGFEVLPGNRSILHHATMYLIRPQDASKYTALDAKTTAPGYPCFGTPGSEGGVPVILGAWAPGITAINYPKKTGLRVEPGSKIVVQAHYNTNPNISFEPDQTSFRFSTIEQVEYEAFIAPLANPLWFFGKGKMPVPAGKSDTSHSYNIDPSTLIDEGHKMTVHGAAMHMHLIGKVGRLSIIRQNKKEECMLNIPRWDFNWQISYLFKDPITLNPGDRLAVSCKFDNSTANQPVVDGKKQTPQDVYWGSGTSDEMCLGFLYITCTDKDGKPTVCFRI